MPTALICSAADIERELGATMLWRQDFERVVAKRTEEARTMAVAARPGLIVVDRELPRSDRLVAALREDATTRQSSIVVMARGDFDPEEVALLEAGANAILRLPPGPEWDARLLQLTQIPSRRHARFPVHLEVEARTWRVESDMGTAVNLSLHGMLLQTRLALRVGDDVDMQFQVPTSTAFVGASGRVARQGAASQFGVEYRLEGDGADQVRRFVGGLARTAI